MYEGLKESRSLYILYALLHDVGKPILRAWQRHKNGMEVLDSKISNELSRLYEACKDERDTHQCISDQIFKRVVGFAPSDELRRELNEVLSKSDALAAAERGFRAEGYGDLVSLIDKVSKCLEDKLRDKGGYVPYNVPLLSTTWLLKVSEYEKHLLPVGCKEGSFDGSKAFSKVKEHLKKAVSGILANNEREVCDGLYKLISEAMNYNLWLSPSILKPENLLELRVKSYEEAVKEIKYGEIAEYLIKALSFISEAYKDFIGVKGIPLGAIETLGELLKYSLLTTPSAVYGALLPDIDLYSHSKLTTAYSSARTAYGSVNNKYRLFVIDANRIQQFISAPVKAKAASRVLRGRSLLIELALDALSRYALKLFGDLPNLNLIISEGGALDILIPDSKDVEKRKERFDEVAERLSAREFSYRLAFTSALSMPYDTSYVDYLKILSSDKNEHKGSFIEVLESLAESLALEKSRKQALRVGFKLSDDVVFDAVTNESTSLKMKYSLVVGPNNKEYVDRIGGVGKFDIGDVLSPATHLSLVAGSASRNLALVVSIYAFKEVDGLPLPCEECIDKLTQELIRTLRGVTSTSSNTLELYFDFGAPPITTKLGLIPLESVGALYILVDPPEPFIPFKEHLEKARGLIKAFLSLFKDSLVTSLRSLKESLGMSENFEIIVRFKLINVASSLIEVIEPELAKEIVMSVGRFADVGFESMFTSSYHPYQKIEDRVSSFKLVSLDEYDLIALVKADVDYLGEVIRLMAFSPSRLTSFSNMLNIGISGKTYLKAVKDLTKLTKEGYVLGVIPLYAGGDDLAIYGSWAHTISFLSSVYESLTNLLTPLSLSASIVIGKGDDPLLDLYQAATEGLRIAKKSARRSVFLLSKQTRRVRVCKDGSELTVVDTIPFKNEYPWSLDPNTASWSLELYSKIVEHDGLNNVDKLAGYLREIDILSRLANLISEYSVKDYMNVKDLTLKNLKELIKLELGYAYVWVRRGDKLTELIKAINEITNINAKLLKYPDEIVGDQRKFEEALRILEASKPLLDLIALTIRKKDTLKHASISVKVGSS